MALRLVHSIVSEPTAPYGTVTPLSGFALEIHTRAIARAKNFRHSYSDMIESLREVEDEAIHLRLGLTSIYQYAIKVLKLSEDVSCDLIGIMRKSRAVPELSEKIRDGSITASKARKVLTVITADNKDAWLKLLETNTCKAIEKAVATQNPKAAVQESIRYKTAERVEFTIGVSEPWIELLKDVKDLLSQEQRHAVTSEEALDILMTEFCNRRDPLKRAERSLARKRPAVSKAQNRSVTRRITRERISAATKNAVMLRDQRQCRHTNTDGTRCDNRRWLDVHHLVPVSRGGTHAADNLITLCSAHHAQAHRS